jgi:hypothetical protein
MRAENGGGKKMGIQKLSDQQWRERGVERQEKRHEKGIRLTASPHDHPHFVRVLISVCISATHLLVYVCACICAST